ncbi:MAG: hypothetical protein AB7E84_00280 [Xanthobacteraceae bacterium]
MAKALTWKRDIGTPLPPLPSRVATVLKAGVAPGSMSDPNWSALSDYTSIASGFLESLRGTSVFDTLLSSGMRRVPLKSRTVIATVALTGATPAELSVKPISQMALDAENVAPRKAVAVIAATSEVFRLDQSGGQLFASELRNGVAVATDAQMLAALYDSVTPTASSGTTADAVLVDMDALLSALTLGASSRVFVIMSPANAAALVTKTGTAGAAFPLLRLDGTGEILGGIRALVSDAVPSGAIIAIDATGIAGNSELPTLQTIGQGDIQLSTTPDSPPSAASLWRSLWQHNERAIVVERFFGFSKIRAGSVSAVSGASY